MCCNTLTPTLTLTLTLGLQLLALLARGIRPRRRRDSLLLEGVDARVARLGRCVYVRA